jgi:hypothetical protein
VAAVAPCPARPVLRVAMSALILAGAAVFLFARLGHDALWDDEAITSLHARGAWRMGDTTAVIGDNIVGYRNGATPVGRRERYTSPVGFHLPESHRWARSSTWRGRRAAQGWAALSMASRRAWDSPSGCHAGGLELSVMRMMGVGPGVSSGNENEPRAHHPGFAGVVQRRQVGDLSPQST